MTARESRNRAGHDGRDGRSRDRVAAALGGQCGGRSSERDRREGQHLSQHRDSLVSRAPTSSRDASLSGKWDYAQAGGRGGVQSPVQTSRPGEEERVLPSRLHPTGMYDGSSRAATAAFKNVLDRARTPSTVRLTRGRDIAAACGQLAATLDQAVDDLAAVGGLPLPAESEEIWRGIWHEETHHSTALEGNTLILRQVELLLEEGRAVGDKELREYLEVQGYAQAANWVYAQAVSRGDWTAEEVLALSE